MVKRILPLLFVIAAMAAYGYYELALKHRLHGSTLIDNPTGQAIRVILDGQQHAVPAGSFVKVRITPGTHRLACPDCGLAETTFSAEPVAEGVINPTRSKYVLYDIIYAENPAIRSQFKPHTVEGRTIHSLTGASEVTTALFIADLTRGSGNIDDKEPSTKHYSRINQDYSMLRKIFRLADFFAFYDKHNT